MTHRLLRLPLALLTLALLATPLAPALAQERPATLADAVRADPRLAEIAALLEESGILADLEQPARFTFFAPSDRALARVDPAVLETVRRDRGALDTVVRHHLMIGASPLPALRRLDAITTLEGTRLTVQEAGAEVRVGGVPLRGEPVRTGNGLLYVVDTLLIPDAASMRKDLLSGPNP
jgi:uncharacterized surface protein with fasciclin (FAS1) repeats